MSAETTRRSKEPTWLVSIVFALMVAMFLTPTAQAQQRNVVAFGDSVLADPRMDVYLSSKLSSAGSSAGSSFTSSLSSLLSSNREPVGANCPSSFNYAKRLGFKLGLPAYDFSCSGAVSMSDGPQISVQVDKAIATGALNSETERVIIASGFNDTYNHPELNRDQLRAQWVQAMAPLVHRIKQVAPRARIQVVGYPTIGTGGRFCLFHLGNNITLDNTYLPRVQEWEDTAQWMQIDLAAATGTEFVDFKGLTPANGMCGTDKDRMWAGLVDFGAAPGNLPLHLNDKGQEFIAEFLATH